MNSLLRRAAGVVVLVGGAALVSGCYGTATVRTGQPGYYGRARPVRVYQAPPPAYGGGPRYYNNGYGGSRYDGYGRGYNGGWRR